MKWRVLNTAFVAAAASVIFTPAFSQNYYLVVGAFTTAGDDISEFTSYLPGQSPDTAYTVSNGDNMLHLYVLKTSSKDLAIASSKKLQQSIESHATQTTTSASEFTLSVKSPLIEPSSVSASASMTSDADVPSSGSMPFKPKGKAFKFAITKDDGEMIPAQIHQVDLTRTKELGIYTAGTYVDVLHPVKDQPMALVSGVFGYKMMEIYVDYNDPSLTEGAYLDEHGAWVVPYKLERLEKGDVSVMYNLAFYKDAVVMLPVSKNELDDLANLMKLNPNYVIRVHAHCNGKNSRKIIALGDQHNFFDVNGSIEFEGSAKQLTNLRGEAVKSYLIANGIDEKRIKLYGWGGAEMLVDQNHINAKINDRIEIEILKD